MDIKEIIDILISVAGLALTITYVTGGLIVNLHLSKYGITQYQILKVKYLAVGLTYFTNFIAILFLSAIPAGFLIAAGSTIQRVTLIVSLIASILLLWLWGKPTSSKSILFSWPFWVVVGSVSAVFPLMIGLELGVTLRLNKPLSYEFGFMIGLAFLSGVLSFVGQVYYYSRHLYGKRNIVFGSVDPIGMGIPIQAQLTGEKDKMSLLTHIGVPMADPETTEKVLLVDETGTHYIIGIPKNKDDFQAVEIAKDIVKAVHYF